MENLLEGIKPTTVTKLEDGTVDCFYDFGDMKLLLNTNEFGTIKAEGTFGNIGCRGTLQLFEIIKEKQTRFKLKDLPKHRRLGKEEILQKGDLFVFEDGYELSEDFEGFKALFDFNDPCYYVRP